MPGPGDVEEQRAAAAQRAAEAERAAAAGEPSTKVEDTLANALQVAQALGANPIIEDALSRSGVTGQLARHAARATAPTGTLRRTPQTTEQAPATEDTPATAVDPVERATRPTPARGSISRQAVAPPEEQGKPPSPGQPPGSEIPVTAASIGPAEEGIIGGLEGQSKEEIRASELAAQTIADAEEDIQLRQHKQRQRLDQIATEEAARLAVMDAQITELRNTQFDASRLFSNASGATQFGAALGIAVGHMLQIRNNILFPGSNTPNAALNIINDAIQRDIRTQAAQFQQGVTVLGQQRTAFQMARQTGLDMAAAEAFATEKVLEQVERHLTTLAIRHQGTQAGFRLQQAASQFRLQRAESARAFDMARQQAMLQALQGGQARATVFNAFHGFADIVPGMEAAFADWWESQGNSRNTNIGDLMDASRTFVDSLDRIVGMVRRATTEDLQGVGPVSAAIRSELNQFLVTYSRSNALGALGEDTLKLFSEIVENPATVTGRRDNFYAQAQALRAGARGRVRGVIREAVARGFLRETPPEQGAFAPLDQGDQAVLDAEARQRIEQANAEQRDVRRHVSHLTERLTDTFMGDRPESERQSVQTGVSNVLLGTEDE